MSETRKPKIHTLTTALARARKYCAYQERSQQEVRDKLYELGLHQREVEQGIVVMIEEGYINEERFAVIYAGGKFRIKKWGKLKIKAALKSKNISDYCIKKALNALDPNEYRITLEKVLSDKAKTVSEKNSYKSKYKIATYAISRGFEQDMVWDLINSKSN